MNDVILNKMSVIERCIKRINEECKNDPENLKSMVGFRNIAVHDYQTVNLSIVEEIIEKHLCDLKEFSEYMLDIL